MPEFSEDVLAAIAAKLASKAKPTPDDQPKDAVDVDTAAAPDVETEDDSQSADDASGEPGDQADAEEGEEQQPEREYFVRNPLNDHLNTTQFNIYESMRWLADHMGKPEQTAPEDVPAGHYASDDVSDEEFADAYARHTGTAYRKRNYYIKSNRPL
ncbi:hypothetical protein ACFYZB_04180 [Streptomyces sp. NPDC001852]|uniref:hypothetical protein n=1 Tax=Streptomyces sp. NPDC001852 TaxID=3364619 RepID=UPI0036BA321B